MMGQLDPFDFALAAELGMTLQDIHDRMPLDEYLKWRAWYVYRAEQRDLAMREAGRG